MESSGGGQNANKWWFYANKWLLSYVFLFHGFSHIVFGPVCVCVSFLSVLLFRENNKKTPKKRGQLPDQRQGAHAASAPQASRSALAVLPATQGSGVSCRVLTKRPHGLLPTEGGGGLVGLVGWVRLEGGGFGLRGSLKSFGLCSGVPD